MIKVKWKKGRKIRQDFIDVAAKLGSSFVN